MNATHKRYNHIPANFEDYFGAFITKIHYKNYFHTAILAKEYKLVNILKILYALSCETLRFSRLYEKSGIRYKRSFLNHIGFILQTGLATRKQHSKNQVYYSITDKGKMLLDIFKETRK